jgi:hypothetical protein
MLVVDGLRQVAEIVCNENPDVDLSTFTAETAAFYDFEVIGYCLFNCKVCFLMQTCYWLILKA